MCRGLCPRQSGLGLVEIILTAAVGMPPWPIDALIFCYLLKVAQSGYGRRVTAGFSMFVTPHLTGPARAHGPFDLNIHLTKYGAANYGALHAGGPTCE
jgi:hypothetical protein